MLASADILAHYDPEQHVTLACDASPYRVGAVLSHVTPEGEKPIAYMSRTLTKAEEKYSQIDKEALAIIFGVKNFSQYLIGRKFKLLTDHQPLTKIFGPKLGIPVFAAARLQRWALMLSAYDYDILYRNSQRHANADGFSRLPVKLPSQAEEQFDAAYVFNMSQIDTLPLQSRQIATETRRDVTLSPVLDYTLTGWVKPADPDLIPYYARQHELTMQQGCVMWGMRVVIPANLRETILEELRLGHQGCVKMKGLARSYVWWPNLDHDIEQTVKLCESCMVNQNSPMMAPLHSWQVPESPWKRIHVDFAGPVEGKMLFIAVDAFSKWPEVAIMGSTTADKTVEVLREMFSKYGLPQQLVNDNGPQFVAEEFQLFMEMNGIKHITSAPYHPASNGLAERFVQTLKLGLKTQNKEFSLQKRVCTFLMMYRNTPHATTKEAPAVAMMGRRLRSRLDLLKPLLTSTVQEGQLQQINIRGKNRVRTEKFELEQAVLARNYREGEKWVPGSVVRKTGPVSNEVEVAPQTVWRRHADKIVTCQKPTTCL